MKSKINGVDMDAAIKYMVKHDCRLEDIIESPDLLGLIKKYNEV